MPRKPPQEAWRPWHPPARSPAEIAADADAAATPSPSAVPPLGAEQIEARIAQRRAEIEQTPCYRCDHKPAAPDAGCVCCQNAHTPNADGHFDGDSG